VLEVCGVMSERAGRQQVGEPRSVPEWHESKIAVRLDPAGSESTSRDLSSCKRYQSLKKNG
jgi:hypothetical protein